MNNAWVIRPYPHHKNRIKEFLQQNIVAIGWPEFGNLTNYESRSEIKKVVRDYYKNESNQSIGQKAGIIYRFRTEIEKGDIVLIPDGPVVYIGKINDNKYVYRKDLKEEGYPHHRNIQWLFEKKGIKRKFLTGRVFDSLKGRQTVFSTYYEDISKIIDEKKYLFNEDTYVDLKQDYLERLQAGKLSSINSNTFEDTVGELLNEYFPGLERQSTRNSKSGDTDLKTELPGNVVVRIQVKHFYKSGPELGEEVVDQLANSMEKIDIGIIVTSGVVSEQSREYTESMDIKIGFIDGVEFVDLLFESIDELSEDSLNKFGLKSIIKPI